MTITIGTKESFGTPQHDVDLTEIVSRGLPVVLLVDSDILAYRASASTDGRRYAVPGSDKTFRYKKDAVAHCESEGVDKETIELAYEPEPETNAIANVDKMIRKIKRTLGDSLGTIPWTLEHFLTPAITFRQDVQSDYKANRKDLRRPANLMACKEYLMESHGATLIEGYEADDLLAIRATDCMRDGTTPIIVSIDKDLDQVPGFHYNFVKNKLYYTTESEARLSLHHQLLVGDAVDNIQGIPGVGPVTARKILDGVDDGDVAMYRACLNAYVAKTPREEGEQDGDFYLRVVQTVTKTMRLLYLCRSFGDIWQPPMMGVPETPELDLSVCPECGGEKMPCNICDDCFDRDRKLPEKYW